MIRHGGTKLTRSSSSYTALLSASVCVYNLDVSLDSQLATLNVMNSANATLDLAKITGVPLTSDIPGIKAPAIQGCPPLGKTCTSTLTRRRAGPINAAQAAIASRQWSHNKPRVPHSA